VNSWHGTKLYLTYLEPKELYVQYIHLFNAFHTVVLDRLAYLMIVTHNKC